VVSPPPKKKSKSKWAFPLLDGLLVYFMDGYIGWFIVGWLIFWMFIGWFIVGFATLFSS
jgi:hypothetical protein